VDDYPYSKRCCRVPKVTGRSRAAVSTVHHINPIQGQEPRALASPLRLASASANASANTFGKTRVPRVLSEIFNQNQFRVRQISSSPFSSNQFHINPAKSCGQHWRTCLQGFSSRSPDAGHVSSLISLPHSHSNSVPRGKVI
jgi:hypothetical protein